MSKSYSFIRRVDNGFLARPEVLFEGPNARTNFDPEKLAVLEVEIKNSGVLKPLTVRRRKNGRGGELEIFDGGRRIRCVRALAAKGHKIEWIPIVIRRGSEAELMLEAAMTDISKEKLDYVDQTNLVRILTGYGLDVITIATRTGMSDTWVRQRLSLIGLNPPGQAALRAKEIKLGKALQMAELSFEGQQAELETVRNEKAAGAKKAGSVVACPGKKACRKMADQILKNQMLYSAQQVVLVLGWVTGDITAEELMEQLDGGCLGDEAPSTVVVDAPSMDVVH